MSSTIDHPIKMPQFTVLMAVYNVEEYIRGTFKSLLYQEYDFSRIQVIIVNDGSTDRSGQIAEQFARQHSNVIYLQQENAGPGAARSKALEYATGEWITVVDPDDILDRSYFSSVADFIERDKKSAADLLITNIVVMNGNTASLSDTHPLNFRFRNGDQLISLYEDPNSIQLGATAFLRRKVLNENSLTYDARIEPTFEDAHLLGRYLACTENSVVGIVAGAKYYYRKRADQSSLVQSGWEVRERYTNVLRFGYLDLFRQVQKRLGYVPEWTQNQVLYDLMWYFKEDAKMNGRTSAMTEDVRPEFLELLSRIFVYIETNTILNFSLHTTWWSLCQALLARFKGTYDLSPVAFQWGDDSKKGTNRYSVITTSRNHVLSIYVNGVIASKTKIDYINHNYFGAYFFTEISVQITEPGSVRLLVDGAKLPVERAHKSKKLKAPVQNDGYFLAESTHDSIGFKVPVSINRVLKKNPSLHRKVDQVLKKAKNVQTRIVTESLAMDKGKIRTIADAGQRKLESRSKSAQKTKQVSRQQALILEASSPKNASKYREAWIILDRPGKADDNAEHFYRYIHKSHPEVNAYFLLQRSSEDWGRLDKEGFRLIDFDSDENFIACLHAQNIISSDAVGEVMYPAGRGVIDYTNKNFIFLQHGVIKDDLSRWLNGKKIAAIVTTTSAEYESFIGKESPYQFSSDQVILTGIARYDALREISKAVDKDFIVVMPTWRMSLRDSLQGLTGLLRTEAFVNSEFGRNWIEFLSSEELQSLAKNSGSKIVFLPHPALTELTSSLRLPEYISHFKDLDLTFQEVLGRSKLYVTDYSSVAFDAAYIDSPVLYFQFDQDTFFNEHSYSKGYFDYEEDGFGPVTTTVDAALVAAAELVATDRKLHRTYEDRRNSTFVLRDGLNCERTFKAICLLNNN